MRILFLCGSLEPGKDGVGDYTRILASELINLGVDTQICALYDKGVEIVTYEEQDYLHTKIKTIRIPRACNAKERKPILADLLAMLKPNWISLQYVPYAYNTRGLPFKLPQLLSSLKEGFKWHIMFHELWIGLNSSADLKSRIVGFLQKQILKQIALSLKPKVIATQSQVYQDILLKAGINANHLRLFSNIEVIEKKTQNFQKKECSHLKIAVFGGLHHGAMLLEFVTWIKAQQKKEPVFYFLGNNGAELTNWINFLRQENIAYKNFGFLEDANLSEVLSSCDIALATTPYLLIEKSGSVAAMSAHHLPVYCIGRGWSINDFENKLVKLANIYDWKTTLVFNDAFDLKEVVTTKDVARRFLGALNS